MALMIPSDIDQFKTDGEELFYRFLECAAKPDTRHVAWYLPDIEGKEPDFILFSDEVGLVIFEVKDWALKQIREADPQWFRLNMGEAVEQRKNPLKQARTYQDALMDRIKDDGRLVSKEQRHHGNPKIPISCGVVFPNINKYEYEQQGLDDVITTKEVFFWDDLHPESDLCRDQSGRCFCEALARKFQPRFAFRLTREEHDYLRQLIFRTVKIELPERRGDYAEKTERLRVLDHNQEAIARKFDGGHLIILGPSGSGKTVILVHKAAFLKQYNPAIRRILFLCYNITLTNYIKRMLSDKRVGLGADGVGVYHFFEFCSKILGEEVHFEKEGGEYYDLIVEETLSRLKSQPVKYDAVLVDEGQDFSDDMYKVVTALLNPHTNNLTIALDEDQNLYARKASWKQLGIQARGRTQRLRWVYRNTIEIAGFAGRFISKTSAQTEPKNLELFPDFFAFHGPAPVIERFEGLDQVISYVTDEIFSLVERGEYPLSEIAVVYARKSWGDEAAQALPKMFEDALIAKGILCRWASEDYLSKRSYDITTNSVTISTIHSTKGLDFACVFLVGLDSLEPDGWSKRQLRNLAYVGMTRARHQLYIPYVKENDLVSELLFSL